ncbi:asparagine synthase (glutamine-hydrolyzing) [Micromonospora sp. WMMD882]|uniref:asparagine synthase (glutamine-hydrolyzing) n=1 Tax=Micromonospora sp. WMMD882 TaxID=3015151 RepID=UPI00248B7246|nr:asparagine synthase (glutamine-hydrolyzing) [Micromonospora sp. WMMD882]WBB81493.1 asparagine synthase (glutamine-hydrolyzing) [Micromonospora sp. WMMD882]
MSGVFGWIDFTRDLVLDRPVVTMLTATLAQRGPDGEAVWVSPRAALGYRTLDVDRTVGRQPFVTDVDGQPVAVAVTGNPLGLEDLRGRLRSAGRGFAPETPAVELISAAYLQWGVEFVPWLAGPFAIVVWDARSEELVLARDQLGGQPLYYTHTSTGLIFATERKALLAHPEVEAVVDVTGLREAISHALPPGPLFKGLESVKAAEIARFGRGGWRKQTYWKLTTRPHEEDLAGTTATVRRMLEDSIRETLPADTSRLVATLSGGIDSSSVAALAAAELRRRGDDKLRTYTVDFKSTDFEADVMRDTRDSPYAQDAADTIGSAHHLVELEPTDILHPIVRQGMLRAKDAPARIYDMETSQYLFIQHAAAQGGKVVLTGGAGDQLFQGARWSTDPGLVKADIFPWIALAQRFGATNGFGTALFNADTLAALDLPNYYRDEYARAKSEIEYLPGEDEWQRDMRRVSYLVLTRGPLDASVFAAAGLQTRAPINYYKLVEYAYNIPAAFQHHSGIEKSLLRAAVADLLPESVLTRRQSATPVSNHPRYLQRLTEEFRAVLADPNAPVRTLIDVRAATELVDALSGDTPRMAKDRLARAAVELALQLNLWLHHYRVRLAL